MKKMSFLIFFSVLIIFGALLFFRSKGSFSSVDSGIGKITIPVGIVFSNLAGSTFGIFSNLGNIGNLQKENGELKTKVNNLESDLARLEEARKENESLKREMGFRNDSGFNTITADISFFDPSNVRESIIVNKGAKDGVYEKMAATSEGVLIGRVSEVYSDTAKIILITDPLSTIPVVLQPSNASGLVRGQVGMGIVIDQVAQEIELKKGDTVVTSGLGGEYPKGLVLGRVENITKKNNSIFQSASVRAIVDFKSLERVQLIKEQ